MSKKLKDLLDNKSVVSDFVVHPYEFIKGRIMKFGMLTTPHVSVHFNN